MTTSSRSRVALGLWPLLLLVLGNTGTQGLLDLVIRWRCGESECTTFHCGCHEGSGCCHSGQAQVVFLDPGDGQAACSCCAVPTPSDGDDEPPARPPVSSHNLEWVERLAAIGARTVVFGPSSDATVSSRSGGSLGTGIAASLLEAGPSGVLGGRRLQSSGGEIAAILGCALI